MLRTIKNEEMETGGTDQKNLLGVNSVNPDDPPRATSTVVTHLTQSQIRPNAMNNNNGVSHRHPVPVVTPSEGIAIRSNPKFTNQPATSAAGSIPKDQLALNQMRASCINCSKTLMRGPMPNQLKQFCSTDCAKASIQTNREERESKGFSIASFRNPTRPITKPAATVTSSIQQIESLGKEICKSHLQILEDQDGGESSRSSIAEDFWPMGSSSSASNSVHDFDMPPKKKKKKGEEESFDWLDIVKNPDFKAAGVSLVKHAPLFRMWDNVTVGMKLEVENTDIDYLLMETAFWVASVIKIQGYFVLLRYEGFGNDSTGDFWINLCSPCVHHVGWCANKGKPLIPPKSIAKKFTDWRNFLVNRLTGARTLPLNFLSKIAHGIKSQNQLGETLEVVDKNQISQLRVASVKKIVGRRLQVEYFDSTEDGGFWCHEESRLIHPAGWAKTIGHRILAPSYYNPAMLASTPYDAEYEVMNLEVGMKLEAIDPLNLSAICAATIKQVLRRGYVMVRVDCYEEDSSGTDWFCYHISSPYVYNCGYCASNGVALTPPAGYVKSTFTWEQYFKETYTKPAPVKVKKILNHKFMVGMKVEVADLMDPRLICVATISQVVGRLLKIHFDGWEEEYDQWMDARSPDIYPIGWCEIVNHRLEPPRPPIPIQRPQILKKSKKGKKKVGFRGGKGPGSKISGKMGNSNLKSKSKPSNSNQSGVTPTALTLPGTKSVSQKVEMKSEFQSKLCTGSESRLHSHLVVDAQKSSSNGNSEKIADTTPISSVLNNVGREDSTSKILAAGIPKLFDNPDSEKPVEPLTWSIQEVADFLKSHDCGPYCEGFIKNDVDGERLMALTKDQIVLLTGMKVGPAVKIFELISQLKKHASAAKARKSAFSK